MKTLWQRLNSPTPAFWRKVRKVGGTLAAVGAAMVSAPAGVHPWVTTAGGYLTVAGTVTMALATLTCTDSPTSPTPDHG